MWDCLQGGATALPPRSSHKVVGVLFTQKMVIALWSVSTQVPAVPNKFGMAKITVSKGTTKTSKAIFHSLSLIMTFQYAAGGQRPRSLHAHSSRPKKTIQIVTEPFLSRDHQHLMGHASCPRGFSSVNLDREITSNVLHVQIKFMVWMAQQTLPLLTGSGRVRCNFSPLLVCVGGAIGRENSVQTAVATLAPCVQTRQKISFCSHHGDVESHICKWLWSSNRIYRLNAHGTIITSSPSKLLYSGSRVDHAACLFWKPGLHYPDTAQVTNLSYE